MPIEVIQDASNLTGAGSAQILAGKEGGPDAILSMCATRKLDGSDAHMAQSLGIATRAAQFVVSTRSTHGASPAASGCASDTKLIDAQALTADGSEAHATLGAISGNDIPLTWNLTHASNAYKYALLCFSQMEDVDAREIVVNAEGDYDTDLGWAEPPNLLFIISSYTLAAAPRAEAHSHLNLGYSAFNGVETHGSVSGAGEDSSSGDSDTSRSNSATDTLRPRSDAPSGRDSDFSIIAHHDPATHGMTGGYRLVVSSKGTAGDCYIYVMAIRGVLAEVVPHEAPTAVGEYSVVNTKDFLPDAVVTSNGGRATYGTAANYHFSVGMWDRYGRGKHMWGRDANGKSTCSAERKWTDDFTRVENPGTSADQFATVNRGFSKGRADYEATTVDLGWEVPVLMIADKPKLRTRRGHRRGRRYLN